MNIGIIGTRGQLGADLCLNASEKDRVEKLDRPYFDLENPAHLKTLDSLSLDVLINTAAYNDVDKAEEEIGEAFRLNSEAPSRLAGYCRKKDILFITFPTFSFDKTE